ncbi:MAG: hypothetical protein KKF76_19855, partial [Gammaproteobacteria bacterium]|nr:hypothetical protein [Gammaproteobacteria bacterium]
MHRMISSSLCNAKATDKPYIASDSTARPRPATTAKRNCSTDSDFNLATETDKQLNKTQYVHPCEQNRAT